MNEFDRDLRPYAKGWKFPWLKVTGIVVGLIAVLAVIGVFTSWFGAVSTVAKAPAAIVTKTFQADNIIYNYEWFHDTHASFKAIKGRIATHETIMGEDINDPQEMNKLRMELAAAWQKCRTIAEKYNANSTKTNREIFKGREAPETLNMEECGI